MADFTHTYSQAGEFAVEASGVYSINFNKAVFPSIAYDEYKLQHKIDGQLCTESFKDPSLSPLQFQLSASKMIFPDSQTTLGPSTVNNSIEFIQNMYFGTFTNLRTVAASAFACQPYLHQAFIPSTVDEVEEDAFRNCGSLSVAYAPLGLELGDVKKIFKGCPLFAVKRYNDNKVIEDSETLKSLYVDELTQEMQDAYDTARYMVDEGMEEDYKIVEQQVAYDVRKFCQRKYLLSVKDIEIVEASYSVEDMSYSDLQLMSKYSAQTEIGTAEAKELVKRKFDYTKLKHEVMACSTESESNDFNVQIEEYDSWLKSGPKLHRTTVAKSFSVDGKVFTVIYKVLFRLSYNSLVQADEPSVCLYAASCMAPFHIKESTEAAAPQGRMLLAASPYDPEPLPSPIKTKMATSISDGFFATEEEAKASAYEVAKSKVENYAKGIIQ